MSAIDDKYKSLGAQQGFLGAPQTPETKCPDGVGHFRHFAGGSIYWHPSTGAYEVHGAIQNHWANLGWERNQELGYPITDETSCPDKIGKFNHFQNGSIYWKPTIFAHAVSGAIRTLWAARGWEKNPELGYPISDQISVSHNSAKGSPSKYSYVDFENGVIYWNAANPHPLVLNKLVIGHASQTAEQVLNAISAIIVPLVTGSIDGHQLNLTAAPVLGGPSNLGGGMTPENDPAWSNPVTDYSWTGTRVVNRLYKVRTVFEIQVPVLANIDVTLDLWIEVFFDRSSRTVKAALRARHTHIDVGAFESANDVAAQLKPRLDQQMNVEHEVYSVPAEVEVLSVKVMSNGDLNIYAKGLLE